MRYGFKNIKNSLTKKMLVYFLIICTTVGVVFSAISYYSTKKYFLNVYFQLAHSCALDVANMMYDAPVKEFLKGKEKKVYNGYLRSIKNIAGCFGLKYIYIYIPQEKDKSLTLLYLVEGKTGKEFEEYKLGYVSEKDIVEPDVIELYKTGGKNLSKEQYNEFGHVVSSYSTIFDKNSKPIAVAGVDIDFSKVEKRLQHDMSIIFLRIFLALLSVYFLCIFYIKKLFIVPIKNLSTMMIKSFKNRELSSTNIELNSDDELNVMADLYNIIDLENNRIEKELSIARTIQLASLPDGVNPYPTRKEFEISADMETAKEVGGDFYDHFFVNDNEFVMLVADISGKGIPAALFMMAMKNVLSTILKSGVSIEEAMTSLNSKICKNNEEEFFATMFLIKVNLATGEMQFVNTGHNPPLIKRANGDFEYYQSTPNLVIGLDKDYNYTFGEDKLNAGDKLFLYTDGITEAMNSKKELYGEDRLLNILNENKDTQTENIIPIVKEDVKTFIETEPQSDDITSIVFKYNGAFN